MDTAEQVVNEMIQEQVLPAEYRDLITGEINKILRNMSREKDFNYYASSIDPCHAINLSGKGTGVSAVNDECGEAERRPVINTELPNLNARSPIGGTSEQFSTKLNSEVSQEQRPSSQDLYCYGREQHMSDKRGTFSDIQCPLIMGSILPQFDIAYTYNKIMVNPPLFILV